MKYILSIDQGTTSTRAILFDQKINIVAVAQKEFPSYYPQPGWVEQNAEEIWTSVVTVIFECLTKANVKMEEIASIGITNQRETTVVWDKKTGKPVYFALVWQSRQSYELCDAMKEKGKAEYIQEKTGLMIDSYFSASKIRWILNQITNGQQKAENGEFLFGTIDTWLVYKLTNELVHITDVSNASRTLLMNLKTLDWDEDLLQLWNIPRCMLPKIEATSCIYGYTNEKLFGASIPISSVVGDQQAALFGQACFKSGDVKNTYGTGCFLLMNTGNTIQHSKNGLLTSVAWKIGNEVNYVLEGSVFVAGAAIQWLRDGIHMIQNAADTEKIAQSIPNTEGVVVVPSFVGLGAPYWKQTVKGGMFGLTRGTSEAHIIRATLESLVYQTYDVLIAMEEDTGMPIHNLKVDGGACRNNFLMQYQADILNSTVTRPMIHETTALGAAFLAGLAVGYWKSKEEIQEILQYETTFSSLMKEEDRKVALQNWKRAIHAVIAYDEGV